MNPPLGTKVAKVAPFLGQHSFAAPPGILFDTLQEGHSYEMARFHEMWRQVSFGGTGSLVEVGSNIGIYAVQAAEHFRHVYGFECHAPYLDCARYNIELNGIKNADIRCVFVYDEDKPNHGKLDTLLPDVTDCTFIEIDTDGNDLHVLNGAREFIRRQKRQPFIGFEFDPQAWTGVGHSRIDELTGFIREFDYRPYAIMSNNWAPISIAMLEECWRLWLPTSHGWYDFYLAPPGELYGILPNHPDF